MKFKLLTICLIFSTLYIGGCATPYQKSGFAGGYDESQLNSNMWMVSVRGNGYTSVQRTIDYTLLRSAEICLEQGYKYFIITSENTDVATSTSVTPKQTSGTVDRDGNVTLTETGGNIIKHSKPSARNTIILINEKPSSGMYYDSNLIIKNVKKKYDLK